MIYKIVIYHKINNLINMTLKDRIETIAKEMAVKLSTVDPVKLILKYKIENGIDLKKTDEYQKEYKFLISIIDQLSEQTTEIAKDAFRPKDDNVENFESQMNILKSQHHMMECLAERLVTENFKVKCLSKCLDYLIDNYNYDDTVSAFTTLKVQ